MVAGLESHWKGSQILPADGGGRVTMVPGLSGLFAAFHLDLETHFESREPPMVTRAEPRRQREGKAGGAKERKEGGLWGMSSCGAQDQAGKGQRRPGCC